MALPARQYKPRGRLARTQQAAQVSPFEIGQIMRGKPRIELPDPITWATSPEYLGTDAHLYPRQATILKTIFLREDLFTAYDYDVIGEWSETFQRTGNEGCQPDMLDRIRINSTCTCGHRMWDHDATKCQSDQCHCDRYDGRWWFREVLMVLGRRGSKNHLGAICGSLVLWHYMWRPGGPQKFYGVSRNKKLRAIVFGGKKEQARANQWQDLNDAITNAACFAPYISKPQTERLTVFAPSDKLRLQRMHSMGIEPEADIATFEIVPSESTLTAGRGPTSFMQFYDEMAHVVATGANRDAEAVYGSATPALDQFGKDAFLYEPSSPWQMMGQFFVNWEHSIEVNEDGSLAYPEMCMFQLPSWSPYEDWEDAHRIPMLPPKARLLAIEEIKTDVVDTQEVVEVEGASFVEQLVPSPCFEPLLDVGAIQVYDEAMRQLEKANPATFSVERRSHWAESLANYLDRAKIEEAFGPWNGGLLKVQSAGILSRSYKAHGDPSKNNANFGFAIAHTEWDVESRMHHVVFDVIHHWKPSDWEDGNVDYLEVIDDLTGYIDAFMPEELTFDQYNSVAPIATLQQHVHGAGLPKSITIFEKTATRPLNWRRCETFKSALNLGFIHIPMLDAQGAINDASELLELELRFLEEKNGVVDHPASGPVQTKDVSDCVMECVFALIGRQMASILGQELSDVGVSGGMLGGQSGPGIMSPGGRPMPLGQQSVENQFELAGMTGGGGGGNSSSGIARRRGRGAPGSPSRGGYRNRG